MKNNNHYSVLLEESIALLDVKPNGIYVDGTFGRGGHTRQILEKLGPDGKLIAFDKDPDAHIYATENFNDPRLILVHDSFARIDEYLSSFGLKSVDGVLLDLGVSSVQLDDASRGFSFRFEAPLDMRMDPTSGQSAKEWINTVDEVVLADVLWRYGEERFSRKIARAIINVRQAKPITTTTELAEIIDKSLPFKEKGKNPATRSFQAIRIFINNELGDLESFLTKISGILAVKGKVIIISFHSLEDRLVKNAFNALAMPEELPKWVTVMPKASNYKVIAKKIKASFSEIEENVRSRSGILRAVEKLV